MTLDQYNSFCASLPHTAHVVQWGGAHVWKVGGPSGKVFAVGGWNGAYAVGSATDLAITFKVTRLSYELLVELPGVRPAPYLAARGMTWVQRTAPAGSNAPGGLDDAALCDYLAASHQLAAAGLPKRRQLELGLLDPPQPEGKPNPSAKSPPIKPSQRTRPLAAPEPS